MSEMAVPDPAESLLLLQEVTGMRVFALVDHDGTIWWRQGEDPNAESFECSVGDRVMTIDELADRTHGR